MGFRQSAAGNAWWGMGAEFYRGHGSTDDYRDGFSLWGVHVLAGKSFAGGLFVDVSVLSGPSGKFPMLRTKYPPLN
ncbi:hypothetical protein LWG77_19425 [Escherichia coli]|nr:hypothetical protein [Escherichia coli]MCE0533133.1 hypothetical protein [Escherichia coli]MCE0552437.1 hypothetical protein [Escherichia coli]QXN18725.1 hypothetical protein KW063_00275 [Escherichia coli]